MAHIRGAVFHNPEFRFHDGEIGNKLLVLLNTPAHGQSFLFAKTTSKKHDKPDKLGCFKHRLRGLFFIPQQVCNFFDNDTWLILSDYYEIQTENVCLKSKWYPIGQINSKLMDQIIDCLFKHHSEDISLMHESWLRPPIESWKTQLADRFNKNR